jgi:pimeloyl-ACP methyl ester carboxylesterase
LKDFIKNFSFYVPFSEKIGEFAYENFIKINRTVIGAKKKEIGEIHYLEINKGHPETILLVHGFTDSKDGFLPPAFFLSKKYNLLIPDLPGSGENKKSFKETYNLSFMAEGLAKFLKNKGIKSVNVAGISMGAAVSMEFALMYPLMVKSLTLVSPAGFFVKEIHSVFHEMIDGKNIFCVNSFEDYEILLERVMVKKPFIPLSIKKHLFENLFSLKEWHAKVAEDLLGGVKSIYDQEKINRKGFNERSQDIKCNTLLVWGDRDSLFPLELSQIPLLRMENSELAVIENAGHALHHERPLDFSRQIHKFLQNKIHLGKS